jgi:hypothetical protein
LAYRVFASPDGVIWRAWDVPGSPDIAAGTMEQTLRDGWLCFESDQEKRRLAPVPDRWSERSEEQLWLYCRIAEPARTVGLAPAGKPPREANADESEVGGAAALEVPPPDPT